MISQYADYTKHAQAVELDRQIQEFLAKGGKIRQDKPKPLPKKAKPKKVKKPTDQETIIKVKQMLKKGVVTQDDYIAIKPSMTLERAIKIVARRTGWKIGKVIANGNGYRIFDKKTFVGGK